MLGQRRQAGLGLYRPEIAVVLAYAKMTLYEDLLASDLPDDRYLEQDLVAYFPTPLQRSYRLQIETHRLRREIIATLVANDIVNRGLGEFVGDLEDQAGCSSATIARGYIVARDAFSLAPLIQQLDQLASQIGADRQIALLGETRDALAKGTQWFLSNLAAPVDIKIGVERFQPSILKLLGALEQILGPAEFQTKTALTEDYANQGISQQAAERFATLPYLSPACEVVVVAEQTGVDVVVAGKVYFALDAALRLGQLLTLLQRMVPHSRWDRLAIAGLYDDIVEEHRRLTIQALASAPVRQGLDQGASEVHASVAIWLSTQVAGHGRWERLLGEMESRASLDLAMLSVAVRALGRLDDPKGQAPAGSQA
jgi:glutamate dehydrogenase